MLVAYDGSLPAMRSLQLFALLGLGEGSPVKLLSVAEDHARRRAPGRRGRCLSPRRMAWRWRNGPSPAAIRRSCCWPRPTCTRARLLVMGAFGTTGLRALLLGSPTRSLLRQAGCAVFVHH